MKIFPEIRQSLYSAAILDTKRIFGILAILDYFEQTKLINKISPQLFGCYICIWTLFLHF